MTSLPVIAALFLIAAANAAARPTGTDAGTATLVERPLFAPDRRPERQATAAPDPAEPATAPRLTGILLDGTRRQAIFAVPAQPGGTATVPEGGEVSGYRVQTITKSAVTVRGPGGVQTLTPHYANGLAMAPAPPAPISLPPPPTAPPTGPERFALPVGPMGLAMYRYSPAAPHAPPPVPDALVTP